VFGVSSGKGSEEGGRSQIAKRGMGSNGVVGFLPGAEFSVELLDAFRLLVEEVIELLVVGAVGALDEGVLLGRAGVGEAVGVVRAGLVEEAEELAAVVGLDMLDREGKGAAGFFEEVLCGAGAGGGEGADYSQPGAGIHGGELEGFGAVGEAQVFGVHLDEGAGESFPQRLGRALTLALEAAEALFPALREKEVVLFEETAEGGGGEADAVFLLKQDGEFVLAPSGKALTEGHHLVHCALGQRGGPDAVGAPGAIFEGGDVLGAEAVEPLVEGARGDGEVAAGESGVLAVSVVEVEPLEAALSMPGKGMAPAQPVKGSG
jgi:hypothetical protein